MSAVTNVIICQTSFIWWMTAIYLVTPSRLGRKEYTSVQISQDSRKSPNIFMALCPDSNFVFGFSIGLNNLFGKSLRNKKTTGKNLSISKVRNQAETWTGNFSWKLKLNGGNGFTFAKLLTTHKTKL